MKPKAMVVTDLDGTLFQRDRRISARNYQTLLDLEQGGILRVIATGRSLFSARKVVPADFPVDYLVFSSGAGIMAWPRQELVFSASMNREQVAMAFECLSRLSMDFMVHHPIPENHHFLFYASGGANPDFEARCSLYREFATPGRRREKPSGEACQLVAIEPYHLAVSRYPDIRDELHHLNVVRTTSPLDGRSRWLEIFSPQVSKATASIRIARELGITEQAVMAVGNDYNDLDLLQWAVRSFVVSDSPQELLARFPTVRSADESDFSQAVAVWRREMEL
ncbi:MAG: HAD family phosphatase [Spirochaetales bacterium]|nr:HAD family phosphatase [Spirochaetales bacterium]